MGSPFPGMDPYLEGDLWQEFHGRLANQISTHLMPMIAPKYVALLERRYVIDYPGEVAIVDGLAGRSIYPDVHVATASPAPAGVLPSAGVAVAEPSLEIASVVPEEVPQVSIAIRDVAQRHLVTVIEILSPANKRGEGAREYEERRTAILRTRTHLLELDLLRQGQRLVLAAEPPPAPYYCYLSRAQRRPYTQIWTCALRAPLPVVPVPLLPPDADVPLDLQAAVRACFDLVGYERLLNYAEPPPLPELEAADLAWVDAVLREVRGG